LSNLPKKNTKRSRIVVFTQGAHNTIVYHDGKIVEIAPNYVPPEEIVDVNGAGDSFAGGFMAGYISLESRQNKHSLLFKNVVL
jgi:adenosine kinase